MGENPDLLGSEVEERGCNCAWGADLRCRAHVRPVAEGREHHCAPAAAGVVVCGIHQLLAVVVNHGEVLQRNPSRLGLRKHTG